MGTKRKMRGRFQLQQVRMFVDAAKREVGHEGWAFLSHRMREALITEKAYHVFMAQHDEARFGSHDLAAFKLDMLEQAGLWSEEETA